MIVKKHLNFFKTLPYVRVELILATVVSVWVYVMYDVVDVTEVAIPNVLPTLLGTALAIFLAFRNNAAFSRWGEAAQSWSSLQNQSRIFARLILTFVDSHKHTATYHIEEAQAYQREMILRHIAYVHALRFHLRGGGGDCESNWNMLQPYLNEEDWKELIRRNNNKPVFLLLRQGHRIYDGMRSGTLQGFDSFQLEGCMAQFSFIQAQCERIKHIPIPRHYSYFTRLFVWFFIVVIPFSYVQPFAIMSRTWVMIPVTIVLAYVFGIIERTGMANEAPFENHINDVPLTALCIDIERDLREMLGEVDLPDKAIPTPTGYLF